MTIAPLRVLQLLTHSKINAGGAVQAFLLSRELVRLGHEVTMCFSERKSGPHPPTTQKVTDAGVAYRGLRLRSVTSVPRLRKLLAEGGFDVVHAHRELALERVLQAARLGPTPPLVANVGTSKVPTRARARRLRSRRIDRVVVVAEAVRRLLVRCAGVEPTKIAVVPGAFDEERFASDVPPLDRRVLGVPQDCRLVGMVANLDPKKGHRVFCAAAAEVLRRRDDVFFVFAGKGHSERLLGWADEAGLDRGRVVHLGFFEDVPALLSALDVCVCSSTHGEGLTGAIREAMAMGTPVVSTNVGGNPEIVRPGRTGLLVPPGDAGALAAAVLETLERPEQARERAERARREVRERFTSRRRAERLADLYDDVRRWRRVRELPVETILFPPLGDGA